MQLAAVAKAEAAGELIKLNETDNIMRGNMSAQTDPDKEVRRSNMASVAMRTSFSDAGRTKRVVVEKEHALVITWRCAGCHIETLVTYARGHFGQISGKVQAACVHFLVSRQLPLFGGGPGPLPGRANNPPSGVCRS